MVAWLEILELFECLVYNISHFRPIEMLSHCVVQLYHSCVLQGFINATNIILWTLRWQDLLYVLFEELHWLEHRTSLYFYGNENWSRRETWGRESWFCSCVGFRMGWMFFKNIKYRTTLLRLCGSMGLEAFEASRHSGSWSSPPSKIQQSPFQFV